MGYRLSKIYTRTGDSGETGLGDGSRRPKSHLRVHAMGEVDELNSHLGLLLASLTAEIGEADFLFDQQHRLFDLGGELSIPETSLLKESHVSAVEERIDALNQELAPLENFILPGGNLCIAQIHVTRAVCRRVERCLVQLAHEEPSNNLSQHYINRLSDYFFVLARFVAKTQGVQESLWQSGR